MGYGPDEIYTRWSLSALPLWQELFAEAGRPELFQRTGVLWIADEAPAKPTPGNRRNSHEVRVPFEKLSLGDCARGIRKSQLKTLPRASSNPRAAS